MDKLTQRAERTKERLTVPCKIRSPVAHPVCTSCGEVAARPGEAHGRCAVLDGRYERFRAVVGEVHEEHMWLAPRVHAPLRRRTSQQSALRLTHASTACFSPRRGSFLVERTLRARVFVAPVNVRHLACTSLCFVAAVVTIPPACLFSEKESTSNVSRSQRTEVPKSCHTFCHVEGHAVLLKASHNNFSERHP